MGGYFCARVKCMKIIYHLVVRYSALVPAPVTSSNSTELEVYDPYTDCIYINTAQFQCEALIRDVIDAKREVYHEMMKVQKGLCIAWRLRCLLFFLLQ